MLRYACDLFILAVIAYSLGMATCKSLANNYDNGDNGNYNDDDTNGNVDDNIGNNNNIDGNEDKDEDDADNNNNNDTDEEENHNGFGINSDSNPPHYDHYDTSNFMGGQLEWEAIQRECHEHHENNASSPNCGNKCSRSHMGPAVQLHKPIKVHTTTGAKPKAGDYEVTVQTILAEVIPLYRGYLSTETPYPGPMEEMRWAKKSWKDSCEECDMQMAFNSEIIKLVSDMSYGCTVLTFPEDHQPQLALPWPDQNKGPASCQELVRICHDQ